MITTVKHFKMFKATLRKLIKLWGLSSWEVVYDHEYVDKRTIATTAPELASRIVVFTLNTDFAGEQTDKELKETALHEVLELLMTKLESMVCTSRKDEAREEVHAIIQTIINVINKK